MPNGLAKDLIASLEEIKKEISDIESEKAAIQDKIKKLRKTSPKSFIESVEASNALSVLDLKLHGELQDKALKWLYNSNYVASSEVIYQTESELI